jgi:hypothetical protein
MVDGEEGVPRVSVYAGGASSFKSRVSVRIIALRWWVLECMPWTDYIYTGERS